MWSRPSSDDRVDWALFQQRRVVVAAALEALLLVLGLLIVDEQGDGIGVVLGEVVRELD